MVDFWGLKPCYPFNAEANQSGHMRFESDSCYGVKAETLIPMVFKANELEKKAIWQKFRG